MRTLCNYWKSLQNESLELKFVLCYCCVVNIHQDAKPDINLIGKPISDFIDYYNENIPPSFPRATRKALEAFKVAYPSLFIKGVEDWTIEKHRKKLMDWLASHLISSNVNIKGRP